MGRKDVRMTAAEWCKEVYDQEERLTDQYGMVCERPVDGHLSGQKLRVEALRAASRIVAGDLASGALREVKNEDGDIVARSTLYLAERLAKWLEGER